MSQFDDAADNAEANVLCASMFGGLDESRTLLTGSLFRTPRNETLWNRLVAMADSGIPVSPQTVLTELQRAKELRHDLDAVHFNGIVLLGTTAGQAGYYADVVKAEALRRAGLTLLTRGLNAFNSTEADDLDAVMAKMVDGMKEVAAFGGTSASTRTTSWTARSLMATQFEPARWAVPGLITEGSNFLAGGPKIGKSWWALGVSMDIACGNNVLGQIKTEQGDVLYLALEDTGRRLQNRIDIMLDEPDKAPEGLTLMTDCPRFGAGGQDHIAKWLDKHPDHRMVVIDVFAKIRPASTGKGNQYGEDYAAAGAIKELADSYAVPFLTLHHTRKAEADDYVNEISGTHGIAGSADGLLSLKRQRGTGEAILNVTGRDVEEKDYALKFTPESGRWELLDQPPITIGMGPTRQRIFELLSKTGRPMTPAEMADALKYNPKTVKTTAWRMSQCGKDGLPAALDVLNGQYFVNPAGAGRA